MATAAECAKQCQAEPQCNGWSHFAPAKRFHYHLGDGLDDDDDDADDDDGVDVDDVEAVPQVVLEGRYDDHLCATADEDFNDDLCDDFDDLCFGRCYIKSSLTGTMVEFPGTESGPKPCKTNGK